MLYITAAQAAKKWGVTVRRIQDMCRGNQIDGAIRHGREWMIPMDAHRPADRRKKEVRGAEPLPQLPRRSPAIIMTDLYSIPGHGDMAVNALKGRPEAAELFRAQLAFCRGQVDLAYSISQELLQKQGHHDLTIGCAIILALCAIYKSNKELWFQARQIIADTPCHNKKDQVLSEFWLAAVDSEIHNTLNFPDWFVEGCFDPLAGDAYPAARYYYLKYLFVLGHKIATGVYGQSDNQTAMNLFPLVAEPMISQTRKDGALVAEIYMRLVLAAAYHNIGKDNAAVRHLDIAIRLALPDKLYLLLAEYRKNLDFLMDERLSLADPAAAEQVKALSKTFLQGWTKLHNLILGRTVSSELTIREREVAKHASYGLSNKEIALRLHISVNTVKQSLRTAMDKTGAIRRSQLSEFI